jgi:hypothetical protein
MANDLGYTPGSGATIGTIQASSDGSHVQLVSLSAIGSTGDRSPLPTDAVLGLGVNVLGVSASAEFGVVNVAGTKLVVDASTTNLSVQNVSGGSLTVGAPLATPVAVRISNGSAFVDTIPVSIPGTVTVAGTVALSGTPAVAQSGVWNIGSVTSITNTVTVGGTVGISGTATVAGTVTANQGTAAALAGAWPVKLTDGTNSVGTTLVGSAYALNVQVVGQTGGGYSQKDLTAFTVGTTPVEVIGGLYDDAALTAPSAGQVSVVRLTQYRAMHINLRDSSGNELGLSAAPLYVQAVGGNFASNVAQVGGSAVVSAAAGVQKVGISDATGTAFGPANPLQTQNAPSGGAAQTIWKQTVNFSASQSAVAIHTPVAGKTAYIEGFIITPTAAGAQIVIFDNTDSATSELYQGMPPLGSVVCTPARPIPLAAPNNVLRYSTGASAAGNIVVWGYDA